MGANKKLLNFSALINAYKPCAIFNVFPPEKFPIFLQLSVAFMSILTKIHSLKRISGLRALAFALAFGCLLNSEIPSSCRKNSKPRWQGKRWPYSFHEVNPAWNLATLQNSLSL